MKATPYINEAERQGYDVIDFEGQRYLLEPDSRMPYALLEDGSVYILIKNDMIPAWLGPQNTSEFDERSGLNLLPRNLSDL